MVKFPLDLYWNRIHEEQESKSAYAKQYPILRKKIMMEALSHPDCPLNASEVERVKTILRRHETKNKVFKLLSRFNKSIRI